MAQKTEEILTLFSKSEEILEMFSRGREFTEELMRENERLRYRIVELESEHLTSSDSVQRKLMETVQHEMERLKQDNMQMSQKLDFLRLRFKEIEDENKDFAQRYVEVV